MGAEKTKQDRGFTLIELLVVMAVIALLISMMLPALAGARLEARKVLCLTHESAILKGIEMYLTEWNDTFPPNGLLFPKPGNGPHSDPNPQHWKLPYGALYPLLDRQDKIFVCPEDDLFRTVGGQLVQDASGTVGMIGGTPPGTGLGYWSYSINTVLNSEGRLRQFLITMDVAQPWSDPLRKINIQSDSTFLYLIEEDRLSLFNDEVLDPPAFNGGDKLTDRHQSGGNLGFADGHAEWQQAIPFNAPALGAGLPTLSTVMESPYTRWFFPDGGAFAD